MGIFDCFSCTTSEPSGQNEMQQVYRLKQENRTLLQDNARLQQQNAELMAQQKRLQEEASKTGSKSANYSCSMAHQQFQPLLTHKEGTIPSAKDTARYSDTTPRSTVGGQPLPSPLAAHHVAVTMNNGPPPVSSNTHAPGHRRGISTASSMYDMESLDDDWEQLLLGVDAQLVAQGQPAMTSGEKTVAVRKLMAVTATRGMDGAIKAAVDDINRFRSWNRPTTPKGNGM